MKKFENFLNFFSAFNGKTYHLSENLDFCCKKGVISCYKHIIIGAYSFVCLVFYSLEVRFENRVGLFTPNVPGLAGRVRRGPFSYPPRPFCDSPVNSSAKDMRCDMSP